MSERTEVTFIGGPLDMHRVWMEKTPNEYSVPILDRRMLVSTALAEANFGGATIPISTAMYRLARWVGWSSEPHYTVYIYERALASSGESSK